MSQYVCQICGYVYDEEKAFRKQESHQEQNGSSCHQTGSVLYAVRKNLCLRRRKNRKFQRKQQ